jgi:hypothetical protein
MSDAGYQPNLTAHQLLRELKQLLEANRCGERLICRYLADLADALERDMGNVLTHYADVYQVARNELGLSVRRTRERIRIGRALRELPAIEQAYVSGELSYSRTREVTRVASSADEQHWLAEARALSMRTLEKRVVQAGGVDDERARTSEAAETHYLSPEVMELRMALPAEVWALLERAMQGARRGCEDSLSDAEALAAVARDALAQQDSGDGDPRRTVVLYECSHCERVELDTGAAPMELSPVEAASLGCGANVLDLRIAGRVVKRGGPLPTSLRNAVLARDRCRCRLPGFM